MGQFPKMNFHTHTTYCDGKESAESMIQAALQKGFTRLGFSGHGFNDFRPEDTAVWCMSPEGTQAYLAEIRQLAAQYRGQIEIFCGIEQDFCSTAPAAGFDYIIGSVHYVEKDGVYYCVDESPETLARAIREGFGGDAYALARQYFAQEAAVVPKTNATFIGHFDLVAKMNAGNRFFDPLDKRYHFAALEAMEALLETGKPFELNTGGIYRGFCKEPYPSVRLLQELHARKGEILFSSDSHDGASLGYRFAEMVELVREIGFRRVKLLTQDGWEDFFL